MDELNRIDDFTSRILVDLLFDMVSECRATLKFDNSPGGVYLFMNEFASFLSSEIEKNPSSLIVYKSFDFLNKVGESNNFRNNQYIKNWNS